MSLEKPQKTFSKSQQLRFALFDLWSKESEYKIAGAVGVPFEEYYNQHMDLLVKAVRDKTEKLSNPEIL